MKEFRCPKSSQVIYIHSPITSSMIHGELVNILVDRIDDVYDEKHKLEITISIRRLDEKLAR